jgi:hypothetical protein
MAILETISNLDISNNIVDTNENIIVWYNGSKIRYYHRYEKVFKDVETINGVLSLKLLNDNNVTITTSSKVRKLILTRPGTTNTYTITLDSNYDTSVDPLRTYELNLTTTEPQLTGTVSATTTATATAIATQINNLSNFSASSNNNIITYTNTGSQVIETGSINFSDPFATGGAQFN